jgi:hypothetical protein
MGEENFLEKAFLPPSPYLSKALKHEAYFFAIIIALDEASTFLILVKD